MRNSLLSVQNLKVWYNKDRDVLSEFSIDLKYHETAGFIGLNGAGKTTFFKTLSGLLPTYQAEGIYFSGQSVNFRDRNFKTRRYTVFAEDYSFQYFTFWEYLSYVFQVYGKEQPNIAELIQGFHFEEYTDVLLKELSMGNRKKAFLITAFALKPELLLLDEPVNGLDFQSTEYLYRQINGYKEYGTVLFSSHILESVTLTSDRVFVLENGRIRRTFEGGEISAANIREALHDENDV